MKLSFQRATKRYLNVSTKYSRKSPTASGTSWAAWLNLLHCSYSNMGTFPTVLRLHKIWTPSKRNLNPQQENFEPPARKKIEPPARKPFLRTLFKAHRPNQAVVERDRQGSTSRRKIRSYRNYRFTDFWKNWMNGAQAASLSNLAFLDTHTHFGASNSETCINLLHASLCLAIAWDVSERSQVNKNARNSKREIAKIRYNFLPFM